MKTTKLKLHSLVDLITNSSTTIYTYSEGAVGALKNLVDEMLVTFKVMKDDYSKFLTCEDIFYVDTFLGDTDRYDEYLSENEDLNIECPEDLDSLIDDILTQKIEKPQWMLEAAEVENDYGYTPPTALYIKPKDEKYKELSNKLLKYLNSTSHEAFRDG